MKIVRTLLFYIILFISTHIFGLAAMASYYITRRNEFAHLCGRWWGRTNLWAAGVKVRLRGLENIEPNGTYIFAANHQSWFDIFALYSSLPLQFRWLAKEELFSVYVLGRAMSATGAIPINRSDGRQAFISIDKAAARAQAGTSILIFPEGTRSPDGVLQEFKSGGFILAIKSRQPVVPISISGSHRIFPKKGAWLINPGEILMTLGKPITTEGLTTRDRDTLMATVREAIREHLPESEGGALAEGNPLTGTSETAA